MVHAQKKICPGQWDGKNSLGFCDITYDRLEDQTYWWFKKKERIFRIVDLAVPAAHKEIINENEKGDKYSDLTRRLKKLKKHGVTMIPVEIGMLGTDPKRLERRPEKVEIGGRIETNQTAALLRSARLQSPGDLMRLAVTRTSVKNHQLSLEWKIPKGYKTNDNNNDPTGWASWSSRNCARNLNLTILTSGICTTWKLYYRMRRSQNSGNLRHKRIT